MCVLCNSLTSPLAGCALAIGQSDPGAALVETDDAAAGVSTTYSMSVGDTFSGSLAPGGDRDWIAITLTAGQTIEIDLTGADAGHGTLYDPYLRVYDGNGILAALNDDASGATTDSHITFTATSAGTYYIAAGSYADRYAGTYRVTVGGDMPPQVADLDTLASYLTDGYWTDNGQSARAFDTAGSNQITVDLTALAADGQQLARWALAAWEQVADIRFVEVSSGAQIGFDDTGSGASTATVTSGATIVSAQVRVGTDVLSGHGTTLDSLSFQTYLHEIGHALGLGNLGNYGDAPSYGADEKYANDSWQASVMSGFSQTDNTTINASYATVLGPMIADIVAIQTVYGAPGAASATAGTTIWGTSVTNLGGAFGDFANGGATANAGGPVAYTIYDRDGIDRLDVSASTADNRIDLNAESLSDIDGLIGNVGIARGTVIENVFGGSGNDTVTGNAAANAMLGNGGDDSLSGKDGDDMLLGGSGNDDLSGDAGDDDLRGGPDDDLLTGGPGHDVLRGNGGRDRLVGSGGRDQLFGDQARDKLLGGGGNDTMTGGGGNDIFVMSTGTDTITDFDAISPYEWIDLRQMSGFADFADLSAHHLSQVGADVLIDDLAGNTLRLKGVLLADLDASDFLF